MVSQVGLKKICSIRIGTTILQRWSIYSKGFFSLLKMASWMSNSKSSRQYKGLYFVNILLFYLGIVALKMGNLGWSEVLHVNTIVPVYFGIIYISILINALIDVRSKTIYHLQSVFKGVAAITYVLWCIFLIVGIFLWLVVSGDILPRTWWV